jgi:DNA-binding transcriptional LysR family regulator
VNWDDLRFLLALSRTGSLAGAARALAVDRTTAGRRLASLEAELGTRLARRVAGGLRLSAAARAIAERAAEMEAAALAIERDLSARESRVAGNVRVTATEALGSAVLAAPLARLAARFPGLEVQLVNELRAVSLARGEADVAVRLMAPSEPTTAGKRVGVVAYALYAARRSPRPPPGAVTPVLLYGDPVAGAETQWLRHRFPSAPVHLRTNSTAALAAAAAARAGIAVLPRFVGDARADLARIDDGEDIPPSELWVLVHRDQRRTARVMAVRECVEAALADARVSLAGRPLNRGTSTSARRRGGGRGSPRAPPAPADERSRPFGSTRSAAPPPNG